MDRFQVHLKGIIELLSQHIYSSPAVFVRELLQNGTDAIRARQRIEPGHRGSMRIVVGDGEAVFSDDGIGLDADEIHRFLATIGESSKRDLLAGRSDYIGQFGIGLLSCFMVADEIVVRTRPLRDARTWTWRGRQDGTYDVREAEQPLDAPGTEVVLRAHPAGRKECTATRIAQLARHYGGMLPFPIRVVAGGAEDLVNPDPPPWQIEGDAHARREALLGYGRALFGHELVDAIPLRAESGAVEGVAYVLPFAPHFGARQKHRVYLRRMLLTESAETLLPDWAFFVRCVVNADGLRPTASREGFYEDEQLERARQELGDQLKRYLVRLAREAPRALEKLLALHDLSMKALALDDDEFFQLVAPWFSFETTSGVMKLEDILRVDGPVRYASTLEGFQQIARVAAAHGLCVINAAYTHSTALLEKLAQMSPELELVEFSPGELPQAFEELGLDERRRVHPLLLAASGALRAFGCELAVRKFFPADVPALYASDEHAAFAQDVHRTKEVTDALFGSLLDSIASEPSAQGAPPCLYLNLHNPVIGRLLEVSSAKLQKVLVEMLYVQALMLAHRPLRTSEIALLNRGLGDIIAAVTEVPRETLH